MCYTSDIRLSETIQCKIENSYQAPPVNIVVKNLSPPEECSLNGGVSSNIEYKSSLGVPKYL